MQNIKQKYKQKLGRPTGSPNKLPRPENQCPKCDYHGTTKISRKHRRFRYCVSCSYTFNVQILK